MQLEEVGVRLGVELLRPAGRRGDARAGGCAGAEAHGARGSIRKRSAFAPRRALAAADEPLGNAKALAVRVDEDPMMVSVY